MALVFADRVKETTGTTGTGTLTLAGAVTGFQSFAAVGNGNTCHYCLLGGNGTDWETGVGTYTSSGTTLSRDTVFASTNSNNKISLTGTSTVFLTVPANSVSTPLALVGSWTFSTNVTEVDFLNLGSYSEISILTKAVTLSVSGVHAVRVSTDNGSTFLSSSGDYVAQTANTGVDVNATSLGLFTTNATAARSGVGRFSGFNLTSPKLFYAASRADFPSYYIPTSSALNAIRVFPLNGGNLTGGNIYVYGRR